MNFICRAIAETDNYVDVSAGLILTNTSHYSNFGDITERGVVITDTLSGHTAFDPVYSDNECQQVGPTDQCRSADVISIHQAKISVLFETIVDDPQLERLGIITNIVRIADNHNHGADYSSLKNSISELSPNLYEIYLTMNQDDRG
jgi:hypothetical protein